MTSVYLCLAILMEPGGCLKWDLYDCGPDCISNELLCTHQGAPTPVPHYRYVLGPIPGWDCGVVSESVPTVEEKPSAPDVSSDGCGSSRSPLGTVRRTR